MKRKIATLFSATMIGLSVAGCSKPNETQEDLKQMETTLVAFADSEFDVKKEGNDYSFDVSKATIDTKNMRSGDDLIISYKGEL